MAEQKIIDIEPKYLKMVQSIFARNLPFKQVWAFGSRVKFTARQSSDLDCVVFGATDNEIAKAREAFDESEVPFEVQLLNFENIPEDFKENIKKEYFVLRKESDWGEFRLGEFADEVRDSYQPKDKDDYIYIGLEHIEQQELRFNGQGHSSEIQSTKRFFQKGDILFGSLRPYFRKVVRPKFFGVCSTDITVIRSNPKNAEQGFLYYLIANKQFIDHASNIANGSRMPRASWKVLESSSWLIPPKKTQRKITAILSAYDDLIENNNKRIKILEEMAQMLYKEWFVNFKFPNHQNTKFVDSELGKIPEGFIKRKISDFCSKITDGTHDSPKQSEAGYKLITGKHITSGFIDFSSAYLISEEDHQKIKKRSGLDKGDILFSNIGTLGSTAMVTQDFEFGCKNVIIFKYKKNQTNFLYTYLTSKNTQNKFFNHSNGVAQKFFSLSFIRKFEDYFLPNHIVEQFDDYVGDLYKLKFQLYNKNQTLSQTRDLLLPRLISGEISVENLEVKINDEA